MRLRMRYPVSMRRLRRWLAFVLVPALSGCAAAPQRDAGDPLAGAPLDFTLTLGVLRGGGVDEASEPKQATASRWVLFPDGSLCYEQARGARAAMDTLPPLARVLNRAQVAEVWSRVRQLGLAGHDASDAAVNLKLVRAGDGEVVHVVDVRANGRRRTIVQRTAPQAAPPALAALADHLGELSWADQLGGQPRQLPPKRYDFGPDPYARYRR